MIPNAKNAYVNNSVATASPARLLVMLCDRLVLDVQRGLEAQRAGRVPEAHQELIHAQEIVIHLRSTLHVGGLGRWPRPGLALRLAAQPADPGQRRGRTRP